jgi:hypothetical protein
MLPKRVAIFVLIAILVVAAMSWSANAQKTPKITGTYTNMYYNKAGGDVWGRKSKLCIRETATKGRCSSRRAHHSR